MKRFLRRRFDSFFLEETRIGFILFFDRRKVIWAEKGNKPFLLSKGIWTIP